MDIIEPEKLVEHLRALPRETEWVEFKVNNSNPEDLGAYISALANSAMLKNEDRAFLIFGVQDGSHDLVGTDVRLKSQKVGAEPLENWVSHLLNPRLNIDFSSVDIEGKHIEIVSVEPAYQQPVRFKGEAFIRIDTAIKKLKEFPQKERAVWAATSRYSFEEGVAATHQTTEEVLQKLDIDTLMSMMGKPDLSPSSKIEALCSEGLLLDDRQGGYDITNLLALVVANDVSNFPLIANKAPRIITYEGKGKLNAKDDIEGKFGYAKAFPGLIAFALQNIPHKERIRHGVRRTVYAIPELALREIIANALIHQDLSVPSGKPTIEIFADRVKITNAGAPLIETNRFIDAPAKSRNEKLAGLMRRLGLCEERGSGIDRALTEIEAGSLPPPLFQDVENSTVVTLYGERPFAAMTKDDKIRACFQHAALKFESNEQMNNGSLRLRFGLQKSQTSQVTSIIKDTIEMRLIKPLAAEQANRNAKYVPFWA